MAASLSDSFTTVLSFAVLGFVAVRLVSGVRIARSRSGRSIVSTIRRRIGWRHVWPVPFVLGGVLIAASVLLEIPGLGWGWWTQLGGEGNPVFGSTESTSGTTAEWIIPTIFLALLVLALPLFAHAEERMFRTGAEGWSGRRRVLKTLQFGAIHALVGIPIGVAIALSVGGAYFMVVYLRQFGRSGSSYDATIESSAAHTAYNGVIIAFVIIALTLSPFVDGLS